MTKHPEPAAHKHAEPAPKLVERTNAEPIAHVAPADKREAVVVQEPPVHGPEQALAAMGDTSGTSVVLTQAQVAQLAATYANFEGALKAAGIIP